MPILGVLRDRLRWQDATIQETTGCYLAELLYPNDTPLLAAYYYGDPEYICMLRAAEQLRRWRIHDVVRRAPTENLFTMRSYLEPLGAPDVSRFRSRSTPRAYMYRHPRVRP